MQQQPRLPLWFLVANWVLVVAAFAAGVHLGRARASELPEPQRTALEIVYHEVLASYIEPVDEHELVERAIAGMVDGLDDYSRYIPPTRVAGFDESSSGNYSGVGAVITELGDEVVVHFPFEDSPAERAGLLPGDVILAVDGEVVDTAAERRDIAALVRGRADTVVRLSIRRGDEERTLEVTRGDVQRPCVKWAHYADADAGLGYVYLADFHPTAAAQLSEAIRSLEAARTLRGLVLDLRFDGGGSLEQCLEIARLFLSGGVIATQHRRNGDDEVYEAAPGGARWPDLPLVLLVNEQSASASEVLAGALQDHDRAVVVGARTHGKGYVNTVYSWKDQDFKLKLTTGSYRTPSGRNIERNHATGDNPADPENGGIAPDVAAPVDEATNSRLYRSLHETPVPDRYATAFARLAARHGLDVPSPPRAADDPQLEAALEQLRRAPR